MTDFKPSKHQQAIFDFVEDANRGSATIEAVAGSGKTTTIVKALEKIPEDRSVLFLAFNKAIADELKARVPKHVRAATFHSQGFGAWMKYAGGKPYVDQYKCRDIFDEVIKDQFGGRGGDAVDEEKGIYRNFVLKIVSLAKGAGLGYLIPNDIVQWLNLIDHFDVYLETEDGDEDRGIALAQEVLRRSEKDVDVVDFDDMLFLPLINNVRFWKNDFVFIDEAQDTNGVQIALLKRMLKPRGRLIAVGDRHQAIYGFRGADSAAMDRISEEFGCDLLPLSVSYRCPRAVVDVAREIVPQIEAHESAPEGAVLDLGSKFNGQLFDPTDGIICRLTAPLIVLAYRLIRERVPCRILGREIGKGLIALIRKMKAKGIDRLIEKLETFRDREIAKHESRGREDKAQAVADRVNSILTMIDNLPENGRTIPSLINDIEKLFEDNGREVLTLATVHKSKGLEWDRVFILGYNQLMPSPWARKEWQKEQEKNLIYVAITRARRELYFIDA